MDFRNSPNTFPLGLRNNNPGNIRPGDNWRGMVGVNKNFVVFSDIIWGIRAMATDLIGDIVKDGKDTIAKLITEYAPPTENDTQSYIDTVCYYTGWDENYKFGVSQENIKILMRSMMNVELGKQYADKISDEDILLGISKVSKTLTSRVNDFFANNPNLAATLGYSLLAALIVFFIIIFRNQIKNFLK